MFRKGFNGIGQNGGGEAKVSPALNEKRSYQLSQGIAVLEDQLKEAQAQYQRVKARNEAELVRLGLQREADFRRMIAGLASAQAENLAMSAELWSQLARQYNA